MGINVDEVLKMIKISRFNNLFLMEVYKFFHLKFLHKIIVLFRDIRRVFFQHGNTLIKL